MQAAVAASSFGHLRPGLHDLPGNIGQPLGRSNEIDKSPLERRGGMFHSPRVSFTPSRPSAASTPTLDCAPHGGRAQVYGQAGVDLSPVVHSKLGRSALSSPKAFGSGSRGTATPESGMRQRSTIFG